MSKVIADISMSLDGYVTGPGADPDNGLGIDGEGIHGWVLEEPRSPVDEAVLAGSFEATGAVVMGRRLFDVVDGHRTGGTTTSATGTTRTKPPHRCASSPPTNRPPRSASRPGSSS